MKFIFVIGGVVSGLGKGITAASIGSLLKRSNKRVFSQKCDPYLNIDPGTMSPLQHGEVFVTKDGAETDLDLGHYERFIDENLSKNSNITAGKIYQEVLKRERNGDYIGQTIQVIPHVTNLIKENIYKTFQNQKVDVLIVEIGGTVGDIESLPFLEAIRQIRMEQGHDNVLFVFVGLLPYIAASNETKTKPIQHSAKQLLSNGIQPDIIVARSAAKLENKAIAKIALFCNINTKHVISAYDVDSIYKIPQVFYLQHLDKIINTHLKLKAPRPQMDSWNIFLKKIAKSTKVIDIHIVGKYTDMSDAYLSIIESLNIAGYEHNVKVNIKWINSNNLDSQNYQEVLQEAKGIIIPGGFGNSGIEGMILAAKYARENDIPFLGICLGMQVACIEFARNVMNIKTANSDEFTTTTDNIFTILLGKNKDKNLGGTLRLGDYKFTVKEKSLLYELYKKRNNFERHRHRYEFNNKFKEKFIKNGLVFSGIYEAENLVEVIEYPKNKFFIASQFHPEFTSRPNKPNPLFDGFIKAVISEKK